MSTTQPQPSTQGGAPAPAEEAVTLSSFDIKAAAEEIYGGKAPAEEPKPKSGAGDPPPKPAPKPGEGGKPGEGDADDGADELEPWDDEKPAPKKGEGQGEGDDDGEEGEGDDDDDLPPDESDERETWRKTRLNKVLERANRQKTRAEQEKARADRLEAELTALRQGRAPVDPTQQMPDPTTQPSPAAVQLQTPQGREQFVRHLVQTDPEINALALAVQQVEQGVQAGAFQDMASYTAALTRASTALEVALQGRITAEQSRAQNLQRQVQVTQATQMQALRSNYEARVKASPIPHMAKLAERIDRVAGQLHGDLHLAILDRPNPEVAAAALASNQDEFKWFAEQSKRHQNGRLPASVLARLGETVARFEARTSPAAQQERRRKVDESLPKTPRSNGGGSQTYEDMDPWEYAQKVQRGQAKDIVRGY